MMGLTKPPHQSFLEKDCATTQRLKCAVFAPTCNPPIVKTDIHSRCAACQFRGATRRGAARGGRPGTNLDNDMCDTLFVPFSPTSSGSASFGKNSGRNPEEPQVMTLASGPHWPSLLSRPVRVRGAETGINCGVVIGNEAVFSRWKSARNGVPGMDILGLAPGGGGDALLRPGLTRHPRRVFRHRADPYLRNLGEGARALPGEDLPRRSEFLRAQRLEAVGGLLRGDVRIAGIFRHPIQMVRFTRLMSVNDGRAGMAGAPHLVR